MNKHKDKQKARTKQTNIKKQHKKGKRLQRIQIRRKQETH